MGMTVIDKPSVYLVGRQEIDEAELSRFLADEGVDRWETDTEVAGQKLVEVAGRLCYRSYAKPRPGGNAAYIGHLLEVGHGSVLECAVFNIIITGVSRSLTHELVRHRVGMSYSQLSQRFVDESECSFVVPPAYADDVANALRFFEKHCEEHSLDSYADAFERSSLGVTSDEANEASKSILFGLEWLAFMESAQHAYARFSERGMSRFASIEDKTLRRKRAREAARSVLPNATATEIFVTGNARALRHFLELRGSEQADAEIRRLAVAILEVLVKEAPNIFGDFGVKEDGSISTSHHKV